MQGLRNAAKERDGKANLTDITDSGRGSLECNHYRAGQVFLNISSAGDFGGIGFVGELFTP